MVYWYNWHMAGKASGMRLLLLLQHSGEANRTPHYIPQDELWWQNYIMLTNAANPVEVGAIISVRVKGDALQHTTVMGVQLVPSSALFDELMRGPENLEA